MSRSGIVALLTDFGHADVYVGVMKGVILGIVPDVSFVDLTHDVPPQDVSTAAWLLSTAWHNLPPGTVFVAVVDPGVGTARRAIAFSAGGRFFVGPDNGIFSDVLVVAPADYVVTLDNAAYHATPRPSATFHGRDIFAPCAAHLVAGVPLASLGASLSPAELVRLGERSPFWEGGTLIARVLHVDHFGNIITSVGPALTDQFLADPGASILIGGHSIAARALTFSEGPEDVPFILRDSSGNLAVAVRNGSAATVLGVTSDTLIQVVGMQSPA